MLSVLYAMTHLSVCPSVTQVDQSNMVGISFLACNCIYA